MLGVCLMKFNITIESFTPRCRNTLRGFCSIKVDELHLIINDIGVHIRDGRSWVSLPSKPFLRNGEAVVDDTGKIKYLPVVEFDNAAVRNAFSDRVIEALIKYDPRALECRESAA